MVVQLFLVCAEDKGMAELKENHNLIEEEVKVQRDLRIRGDTSTIASSVV